MNSRIFFSACLFLGFWFLPWWIIFGAAFFGLVYFRVFFEAVFIFFLADLIYGLPLEGFMTIWFPLTFFGLFILILTYSVRDHFLLYN